MERWEFLIQKEGDRVWTPINQSTWDLEEGRYRVVAHSSKPNFEIEIRITHQSLESERPLTQIKNCCRRTNGQGLIMILPFTYLEPGTWELRCYNDLMSEFLGQGWQKRVRLQVASKIQQPDSPSKDLPEPPQLNETTPTEAQTPEIPETQDKAAYYLQKLNDLLRHKIEPMLISSEINTISFLKEAGVERQEAEGTKHLCQVESWENKDENTEKFKTANGRSNLLPECPLPPASLDVAVSPSLENPQQETESGTSFLPQPNLKLFFNQHEFNRSEGEPILISGTVNVEEDDGAIPLEFKGKLRYQLLDPDTEEVILNFEELVEEKFFPFIFSYALDIPAEWEMEFLIAEVSLETEDSVVVACESLTITTELNSSVTNAINYTITLSDTEEKTSFAFDLLLDEEIITSPLNIDLPQPSKMGRYNKYFQPSEGQILPPKIARPSEPSKTPKTPKLPQIRQPQSNQVQLLEVPQDQKDSKKVAPVEPTFQALELKERFIERLSSLAGKMP